MVRPEGVIIASRLSRRLIRPRKCSSRATSPWHKNDHSYSVCNLKRPAQPTGILVQAMMAAFRSIACNPAQGPVGGRGSDGLIPAERYWATWLVAKCKRCRQRQKSRAKPCNLTNRRRPACYSSPAAGFWQGSANLPMHDFTDSNENFPALFLDSIVRHDIEDKSRGVPASARHSRLTQRAKQPRGPNWRLQLSQTEETRVPMKLGRSETMLDLESVYVRVWSNTQVPIYWYPFMPALCRGFRLRSIRKAIGR
jgi:hypothetical protein